jgi:NAD+ synthase (glutamine-hydrolysing)
VGGNDQLVFDGYSAYLDAKGHIRQIAKGFQEDEMLVDLAKEPAACSFVPDDMHDLYQALVLGVRDYMDKQGFKKGCLGLSGGIDSALVACIAVDALGRENVLALSMPSRYSSPGSVTDAQLVAKNLGIELMRISIEEMYTSALDTLQSHFQGKAEDVTEENLQARLRGLTLMALSNKFGYIVLSTGNKSEMAMGYCTLYGDMAGGLSVISDVNKQQVYALCHWINRKQQIIPQAIFDKPPSAELKPEQRDTDTLPDYAILDAVLQGYVEEFLSPEQIAKKYALPLAQVQDLIHRIHSAEYKRRQAAPGIRVSKKAFRVGRRYPIVQGWM